MATKTSGRNIAAGPAQDTIKPVAPQLATPTDLDQSDVIDVTEALNGLIADAFALYIKTKNFHWHLSGLRFRDLHLLFDEQADALFATIDPLAERVRRIGGTTIRSIGHIARISTITDDDDDFVAPQEMVRRLCEDNQQFTRSLRDAHDICDDANDVATASILEPLIDESERRTWFLFETLQGKDLAA
jgi:starvation-inducible DNA-binding protein